MGIERRAENGISTVGGGRPNFRRTGRRRRNWTKHRQYRVGRYSRCSHSGNEVEVEKGENKGKTRNQKERRTTACTDLKSAYTRILKQQEESHCLVTSLFKHPL